ncbi:MAG TPA: amidohydrolase family protein [Ktedonobacterales bacterium]
MIVDAHTHIFPPEIVTQRERFLTHDSWFAELYSSPRAKLATADDLIEAMDLNGIDLAIACSFGWRDHGLIVMCNDYMIESVRANPTRLVGLAGMLPQAGGRAADEVARCAAAGLAGIGELMPHGQGYRLGDTRLLAPVMAAVAALDLIVLAHASEPVGHTYLGKGDVAAGDLYAFIRAWPQVRTIAAHWGGGFPFFELMPEVRAAAANLWYDTAASPYLYLPEIFTHVVEITGGERILWATDFPLLGHQRVLDHLRASGLDEVMLARVLGGNAAAMLRLGDG